MLKVENVTKYYGDFLAVDNLSFTVKPGEIFGLLGVNGAGKTTTFRMIMGLLDANSGSVTLNGKPIDYSVTDTIGFLTEERSLLTKMTVREQCLFFGTLKGMTNEKIIERLVYLLDKFEIPEYIDKKIKELSKGNQQKIQFITAILNEPKLVILDEPFAGLDPFNVEMFKKEIIEMAEKGSMIIFSTHRMEHVELFCKKLVILLRGKTVISGYLSDIKEQYRKKNILIKADITKKKLEKIDGVTDVIEKADEFEVKIEEKDKVKNVFAEVSKCKNVSKFVVEEPSLNEIFIAKVGESYEK
ncbi:MAG: ATP-binding cassette domain-containing protein [Bacilli bacterium]|nr:ATP-binding cassette domain-containing protein [Bacilli bacterium]MDD4809351.1 ATP-binding cassette domain-containing protein [Bacilli bacterium]